MVKNHHLAKSISDAAWSEFRRWLEYFGKVFGVATVAVKPHYTTQCCSDCGCFVNKSLSTRTHKCKCGFVLDRDGNAAINILKEALRTVGHTGTFLRILDKRFGTTRHKRVLMRINTLRWLDERRIPRASSRGSVNRSSLTQRLP